MGCQILPDLQLLSKPPCGSRSRRHLKPPFLFKVSPSRCPHLTHLKLTLGLPSMHCVVLILTGIGQALQLGQATNNLSRLLIPLPLPFAKATARARTMLMERARIGALSPVTLTLLCLSQVRHAIQSAAARFPRGHPLCHPTYICIAHGSRCRLMARAFAAGAKHSYLHLLAAVLGARRWPGTDSPS